MDGRRRRFILSVHGYQQRMSLVAWPDGLVRGPDGPCRQIPQPFTWSSVVFITRDGTARRRHFNPATKTWTFDPRPLPMAFDALGDRMGYHVAGRNLCSHWVSMERAVLMAWAHRSPDGPWTVEEGRDDDIELVGAPKRPAPLPFAWAVGEWVDDGSARMIHGETWKALRWSCGLSSVPKGYEISSHGRLRNKRGQVTRGLWYNGDRFAGVRGGALVNLTVAAGLRRNDVSFTPALWTAVEALAQGEDAFDLARLAEVQVSTAWNRFCRVAPFLPPDTLKSRVGRLVSSDLWELLTRMGAEQRAVVGGPLTDLMPVVQRALKRSGPFRSSEWQWEELRLGRLAAVR